MTIEELTPGQELELEVIIGTSSFSIKTSVVGAKNGSGILVEPYKYKGAIVDLASPKLKHTIFNLHYIDQITYGRFVWNNVSVKLLSYKGRQYYAIDTRAFAANSKSSERRVSARMPLNIPGRAVIASETFDITPIDVSDSGFAFSASSRITDIGDTIIVQFSDTASNTVFDMILTISIVRFEERNGKYFYAGIITNKPDKMLAYLCFKRIDPRKNAANNE